MGMTREERPWAPGDLLSIVGRGHEGRPLFATDEDRRFFVGRLARVFVPEDVDLLGWALLINHYHLMMRVTDLPPETLFRRLNTAIGMRERRRRGDHGTVFQGRYWSGRCEKEGAALSVLTYVLGNPVHHGVVPTGQALESYEWSAYGQVLGVAARELVDPRKTLALLHPDEATARALLRDAMASRVARWQADRAGIDPCEEPGCRGARDGCLLVHTQRRRRERADASLAPAHIAWRPPGAISSMHDERMDRQARLRLAGWRPVDLVGPVCAHLGADEAAMLAGRRTRAESAARSLIAHVACDGVGTSAVAVAELLGVSGAAISLARARGRVLSAARGWSFDEVLSWRVPAR